MTDVIPFNKPFHPTGTVERVIAALESGHTAGDGPWTKHASELLGRMFGGAGILLTPSCTHALEMAVRLLDPKPGDEIIVPSFTFTSTANAIVLGGAIPVFVDIEPQTQNVDTKLVEAAITDRTIAVFCINYGGLAPEIELLSELCSRNGLVLIEDNAHGLGATVGGRRLGTIGSMATQSFHETKNIQCGEGGCLVVKDGHLMERAEILREKGTDRSRFFRGQVDKYTWISEGSSWLLADTLAAVLSMQLEQFEEIQSARRLVWETYSSELASWQDENGIEMMTVPPQCVQPYHMFYMVLPSLEFRTAFMRSLREDGVTAAFHYQPLHSSEAGRKFGRAFGEMVNTQRAADRLIRLPLWAGMTREHIERVVASVTSFRMTE